MDDRPEVYKIPMARMLSIRATDELLKERDDRNGDVEMHLWHDAR